VQHFYHASQYQTATPPPSYWHDMTPPPPDSGSLHELQHCDVAIVGAGLTGLSAALHLARDHGIRVVVVDARGPGLGCLRPQCRLQHVAGHQAVAGRTAHPLG